MCALRSIERVQEQIYEIAEAGKRQFWDLYQENGNRTGYDYAFSAWENKWFTPYHELGTSDNPIEAANYMFYGSRIHNAGTITLCDEAEVYSMFHGARRMTAVHIIIQGVLTDCENMFALCDELADLTIEGKIAADMNLQWCYSLTEASLRSVVNALEDLYDAGEKFEYSLTFSAYSMEILRNTNLLSVLDEKGWNY